MILLSEKEPVSAKQLAFSLGISEKTVQKYTAQLKTVVEGNGASIITRQRVGSSLKITDPVLFKQFLNRYNSNLQILVEWCRVSDNSGAVVLE